MVVAGADQTIKHQHNTKTKRMVTQEARKLGRQCKRCQKFKSRTEKYGHLEPKQAETLVPWHTVCVDLIGMYDLTAKVRQP